MKILIATIIAGLFFVFVPASAHAAGECVEQTEWKTYSLKLSQPEVRELFGTMGVRDEKRSNDGRVVRVYPLCGYDYLTIDEANAAEPEAETHQAGSVTVVFDINHHSGIFAIKRTYHNNF
jgi:hypothetical protein